MAKKNAIKILKDDHEKVRGLLEKLEKTTERAASRRQTLLEEIANEVRVHARVEEEVFYPAYREAASKKEDLKLYFEAIEEHGVVDMVLPKLEETEPDAEDFAAKAKVLKDLIEHHAEEEEKQMFPRARKLFDADELADLGEQIEQRKVELMAELEGESGAPSGRGRPARSRAGGRDQDGRAGGTRTERGRGGRRGEGAMAEVEVGAEAEE